MARGRIPRRVREPVPDDVRCTPTTSKAQISFQRQLVGGTFLEHSDTQSRFQFRHTKARSQHKPLIFHLRPTKPRSQFKPLNFYKRRKSLQQLKPGAAKELPPNPCSSPSPGVLGSLTAQIQGSTDTANQNPSSVVEDPVLSNAGTKEGTPNSEASVSATPNNNTDPNPNPNPNPNASSNGFQKNPSIWQAVEKLKVFSQDPQQPHFMKLQSLCPAMREGAAIGLMVTYANLTDLIKDLSYDDDVAVILEKIACLNPLEENGFDVGRFRTRLRKLLYIKTQYMESASQISRLELELSDMETAVASLKRVKETISRLMKKKDQLLDQTVGNGHEISRLKEAISELNRLNEPEKQEFASLLA